MAFLPYDELTLAAYGLRFSKNSDFAFCRFNWGMWLKCDNLRLDLDKSCPTPISICFICNEPFFLGHPSSIWATNPFFWAALYTIDFFFGPWLTGADVFRRQTTPARSSLRDLRQLRKRKGKPPGAPPEVTHATSHQPLRSLDP